MPLRIVFMGTPDFAVTTLAEIMAGGHEIVAVYTRPPSPAGRGMDEQKSPVHTHADRCRIPVFTPQSLKAEQEHQLFRGHGADVAVVVAYGLILPKPILEAPRAGCLNLHASALPRWRGAAPIQRAIMAGDTETAVMVMRMEEGLDSGPICLAERAPIGSNTTAGELHDHLARLGASLMIQALAALERGSLVATPQASEGVTYAAKVGKAEARIDFTETARDVHNRIRALSPFPGAWFEVGVGAKRERVKVLRSALAVASGSPGEVLDDALTIACGEGAVRLVELQRAGKKPMRAEQFLRGFPVRPGTKL
jgi:methionyl-tRNA formyltransferase